MRKIKLQMQITIDGFVGRQNGDLDWMVWDWDDELKKYTADLTNSADTFLMGRVLAQGMSVYWPTIANNPEAKEEDKWMAERLNNFPKVAFSKTVDSIDWTNITVASDIVNEVKRLKDQPGKDIIVYGGAKLVSSFIKEDLIDEYYLFVNPVAIGKGITIFDRVEDKLKLKLVGSMPCSCGIVVNCCQPEKNP